MKRIFHEVAAHAELGIVLGVVVQVQGTGTYHHYQQTDQKADDDFEFFGATVAEHHCRTRNQTCFYGKSATNIYFLVFHHHPKCSQNLQILELKG